MGFKFLGDAGGGDPQISKYFTLSQLTVTNTGADNTPDASSLTNLNQLGQLLDLLYDTIGPFNVISAFRSKAVEDALSASGQPTAEAAAGHISFHEVGLAADIYPTNMSLDEYWGKMMAALGTADTPGPLWNQMSEMAYKPTQGSIHVAGAVDYRNNNVVLALNSSGTYASLTADEIDQYAGPYLAQAFTDVAAVVSSTGFQMTAGMTLALLALGAFVIYQYRKPLEKAFA
jgi:hypothetical protein